MPRAVAARSVLAEAVKGVVSKLRAPGKGGLRSGSRLITPELYGVGRYMVEQLENRTMLTIIPGAPAPAGTGIVGAINVANTFDYQDQFNNRVRVLVQGNIKVELIGSDVNAATNAITLNEVPGTLTSVNPATGQTTTTQFLGGFGGGLGSLPVTGLNLNTIPPSVNFNPPAATTNITDIGSQQDPLFPLNPAAQVGGDNGLGNFGVPQGGNGNINFDAIAANAAGQTFGFNVVSVPVGTGTRILVQLVQFNNQNGNATVVEDLNRNNTPGVINPATGNFVPNDANRFGTFLFPPPSAGTQPAQMLPAIESADFLPTDDTKLYFVAVVPTVVSGAGGTATTIQAPRLFIYDFTQPLGHRITLLNGDFNSGATPSVVNGLAFNPNDNHLWVFGTFPFGTATRTGLVDLGANPQSTQNVGAPTPVAGITGTVEDIEFLGSGPGDINNDPGGIFIMTDTDLFRADITRTINVAGVQSFGAEDFGPLTSFPAGANAGIHGGTAFKDITYNPAILNPFFLAEDPNSTRRGVFLGTDTTTDELLFIDFRNRHPSTDVFTIFVTKNDPNGSSTDGKIAISTVGSTGLTPYTGGVSLHVAQRGPGPTDVTMGPGGVLIGALSIQTETINNAQIDFGNVPFGSAPVPANTFTLLPSTITSLAPGLITAPGISLDSFLLGGTITGAVNIADSIQTFYAGAIVTGDASGNDGRIDAAGNPSIFQRSNNTLTAGNFSVGGDLRELVVAGNISSPLTGNIATDYTAGTDFRIGGRVGEIHVGGSSGATGLIVGSDIGPVLPGNIIQREIEFRGLDPALRNGATGLDFAQFKLSPEDGLGMIVNDTQPQYLGTINSTVLGATLTSVSNVVQVRGVLQNIPVTYVPLDTVDNYGVGLLAGQTYTFQLLSLASFDPATGLETDIIPGDPTSLAQTDLSKLGYASVAEPITLELIDPDGRVVATDFNNVDLTQTEQRPFSYKADRPGVYTIRVTASFLGTTFLAAFPYEVRAFSLGKISVGGYRADGSIDDARLNLVNGTTSSTVLTTGFTQTPGLELQQGDFGVLDAASNLFSASTNFLTVDNGNMRVILANDIGQFGTNTGAEIGNGDFGNGIDVYAPHGALGLVRTLDASASGVMDFNRDDGNIAFGGNIQLVDAPALFFGNLLTNKAIGVIRVGDLSVLGDTIGVFSSAGTLAAPSVFAANFDNVGNDGFIDLIDQHGDARNGVGAAGEFGTLGAGGPAITTGPGGDVRYIRAQGIVHRDAFFGGGSPDITTSAPGASLSLTDDSGGVLTFIPTGAVNPNLAFNPLLPEDPVTNPRLLDQPTLTALTYPIRGSGGSVIVNVTSTQGLTINSSARGSQGAVEVSSLTLATDPFPAAGLDTSGTVQVATQAGNILVSTIILGNPTTFTASGSTTTLTSPTTGATVISTAAADTVTLGTANTPLNLIVNGATTDIFDISAPAANFDNITNNTGGEIVNTNINSVGNFFNNGPIGLPKSHTGEVPRPFQELAAGFPTGIYPFQAGTGRNETLGVYIATNAVDIRSAHGIGNVAVGNFSGQSNITVQSLAISPTGVAPLTAVGNIGELSPDFKGGNHPETFDGIDAPAIASGTIVTANIGEGILPTGSGENALAGLYAYGPIDLVQNSRSHADIRGNIESATRIGQIRLTNASIINSNIFVTTNVINSSELTPGIAVTSPTVIETGAFIPFTLANITVSGDGGIIGSSFEAATIGPVSVSGFGLLESSFVVPGNGLMAGIQAGGYGIRDVRINAGSDLGYLKATGNGSNLPTNKVSTDVRFSESSRTTDELSTADPFFGLTPNRLIDIHANLGTSSRTPSIKGITNTGIIEDVLATGSRNLGTVSAFQIRGNQPFQTVPPSFIQSLPNQASTFNFGESIGTITTKSIINGLSVTTGQLKNFTPGSDVLHTSITVASKINTIHINGSLAGDSLIQTTGFNSSIGSIFIKKNLNGTIITTGRIGTISVGGSINGSITINNTNRKSNALNTLTLGGNAVTGSLTINGSVGAINVAGSLGKVGDIFTINGNLGSLKVGATHRTLNGGLLAGLNVTGNVNSIVVFGRITGALNVTGNLKSLSLTGGKAPQSRSILTSNVEVGQNLGTLSVSNGSVSSPSIHAQSIGTFLLNLGNLQAGAALHSDSTIKSVSVKRGNIFGTITAVGNLNSVAIDGNLGNGTTPLTIRGDVIGKLTVGGSVFSGVTISGSTAINHIVIGGNFEAGAVIQTPDLGSLKIGGAKRGQIVT
jgi:hypothetical protein